MTWLDAKHEFDPACAPENATGLLMNTVGYLLRRDDEYVVVAMERVDDSDDYRNVTTIPRSLVKSVRYVKR